MTQQTLETILILASELFFISANASQLIKLIRTRNRKGLSAVNQSLNASGNAAWMTYFISIQRLLPTVTNAIMLLITVAMLAFTLADRTKFAKGIVAVIGIGGLISLSIIYFPQYAGWVGVLCNLAAMTPWVVHILHTKKTSGISDKYIFLSLGAIACNFTYAILIQSAPVLTGALIGIIGNLMVLFLYYKYRNRR